MKFKRIIVFAAVFAMILSSINFAAMAADPLTLSANAETAWAGSTFRVDVTMSNTTQSRIDGVVVAAVIESPNRLTRSGVLSSSAMAIEAGSSSSFPFYFDAVSAGTAQIRFTASRGGYFCSEYLMTITVYEPPETPPSCRRDVGAWGSSHRHGNTTLPRS